MGNPERLSQQTVDRIVEKIHTTPFAFDTESDGPNLLGKKMLNVYHSRLVGFSICFLDKPSEGFYIPVAHEAGNAPLWASMRILRAVQETKVQVWAHNWKHDGKVLALEKFGVPINCCDSLILMWLLCYDANGRFGLKDLARKYLDIEMTPFKEVLGEHKTWAEVPLDLAAKYGAEDAEAVAKLVNRFFPKLQGNLWRVFFNQEMPMVACLRDMENAGFAIDRDELLGLSDDLQDQVNALLEEWDFLFPDVLISSAQQVATHFYQGGLWPTEGVPKGKNGFRSTGRKHVEGALDACKKGSMGHIGAELKLKYQDLNKYLTTFTGSLVDQADQYDDGRLRCNFRQHGTATGRLSCANPNLQNIPTRSDYGKRIRKAFIAPPGKTLVVADYSQIELRVLAHLAGGGRLAEAYLSGADVHQRTADLVGSTRRQAKTINFATVYGARAKKLAEQLEVTVPEAQKFLDNYNTYYPEVLELRDKIVMEAYEKGYVSTLSGRIRKIPQLVEAKARDVRFEQFSDKLQRWFGERVAFNTPVQGGAADLVKMAMLRFSSVADSSARLISQVHDELIVECDSSDKDDVIRELRQAMEGAAILSVPLVADPSSGSSWGLCK